MERTPKTWAKRGGLMALWIVLIGGGVWAALIGLTWIELNLLDDLTNSQKRAISSTLVWFLVFLQFARLESRLRRIEDKIDGLDLRWRR